MYRLRKVKRKLISIVIVFIIVFLSKSSAISCDLYYAYITHDANRWGEILDSLDVAYSQNSSLNILEKLVLGECGYISLLIELGQNEYAIETIEVLEMHLESLKAFSSHESLAKSIKASVLAYKANLNPGLETMYGPASLRTIDKAIAINSDSPYAWSEKASMKHNIPSFSGSSYLQAISYYTKSLELFENGNYNLKCNWYYLNTMYWLAKSYEAAGMEGKAYEVYTILLTIEPMFELARLQKETLQVFD